MPFPCCSAKDAVKSKKHEERVALDREVEELQQSLPIRRRVAVLRSNQESWIAQQTVSRASGTQTYERLFPDPLAFFSTPLSSFSCHTPPPSSFRRSSPASGTRTMRATSGRRRSPRSSSMTRSTRPR